MMYNNILELRSSVDSIWCSISQLAPMRLYLWGLWLVRWSIWECNFVSSDGGSALLLTLTNTMSSSFAHSHLRLVVSRDHRPCLRRCVRGGSLLAADDLLQDRSPPSSASAGASSPLLLGHFRVHHCTTFFCLHFRRAFFPTLGTPDRVPGSRFTPAQGQAGGLSAAAWAVSNWPWYAATRQSICTCTCGKRGKICSTASGPNFFCVCIWWLK